jgi:tetratricopeptide (TPR) repeat protein
MHDFPMLDVSAHTLSSLKEWFDGEIKAIAAGTVDGGDLLSAAKNAAKEADALSSPEYIQSYYRSLLYNYAAEKYRAATDYTKAGKYFHYAGHGLRSLEEYNRAAKAYMNSGQCYRLAANLAAKSGDKRKKLDLLGDAIRSYRRAKGVWSDVGNYDDAGVAFWEEQKLFEKREFAANKLKGIGVALWGWTTGYGESFWRWGATVAAGIVLFALLNMAVTKIAPGDALQRSVQRMLLLSAPGNTVWLEVTQAAYSYFMLGLGLAIITRKFGPR